MRSTGVVLALCLLLRLLITGFVAPWTPAAETALIGDADPRGYHLLAVRLVEGKGYLAAEPDRPMPAGVLSRSYPGEPEALWPPGYAAFLAFCYALFGVKLTPVILLQVLLATIGCYWIMRAAETLWSARVGIVAGLVYALEPISALLSNRILSEALFLPMLSFAVYALSQALTAPTARAQLAWLIALGATFGAANWVRVSATPLFIALSGALLVWLWIRRRNLRTAVLYTMATGLTFLIVISPWCWRNYRLFGVWAFSTSGAYNLLAGFEYRGDKEAMFHKAYLVARAAGVDPTRLNPFERARFWRETALAEWRDDPVGNLRLHFKRLGVMMLTPGTSDWGRLLGFPTPRTDTAHKTAGQILREFLTKALSPMGLIGVYSLLFTGSFYLLWFVGLLSGRDARHSPAGRAYLWIASATALLSILTTIVMSDARGRAPALLLLTPVVSWALGFVWEAGRIRLWRRSP